MKKVLILAYDFPPYVSVGGLRPYSWYKYFNDYGIYPVVITRQWENKHGNHLDYVASGSSKNTIFEESQQGCIIRSAYSPNLANRLYLKYGDRKFLILRKIISGFYEYFQFFFNIGTKAGLYKVAKGYLDKNKVDLIIATADPFVLFKYASKLSKKHNTPWIADYRDPWSQGLQINNLFSKKWNSFWERKIVSSSSSICTVSTHVQKQIEELIPKKPFIVIPNGYDLESLDELSLINQNDKEFSIAFSGTINNWHPIKSFLSVLFEIDKEFPNIKIKFYLYGINNQIEIESYLVSNYNTIKNLIIISKRMPPFELLKKMASHNVLLLFNDYSLMGTKIYNYLALRRKILLCYMDDEESNKLKNTYFNVRNNLYSNDNLQSDLIISTNSGILVKDNEHLKETLILLYQEFKEKGFIECNSKGAENYSRKIQAMNLAEAIKSIINKEPK